MGNECEACEPAIGQCRTRDIFKEQPRNRADLDLSQIKKGSYKRKPITIPQKQIEESEAQQFPQLFVESVVVDKHQNNFFQSAKKLNKENKEHKTSVVQSSAQPIKKPLTLESEHQTLDLKKGVKYVGSTVGHQPHEKGKVIWEDGTALLGTFFLGQLAQHQKVMFESNGLRYQGQVLQGKANSQGKLTMIDGSSYEGEWKEDVPHGYGKHRMTDGSVYEGHFLKGGKSGRGKLYFNNGMYDGGFLDDSFHGEGILILNDGRQLRGSWKDGLMDGKGQIEWSRGQKFVGTFQKGCRHGSGTYWFSDGRQWTGEWSNDLQNGFGCFILPSGETIKGIWSQGIKTDQMRETVLNI